MKMYKLLYPSIKVKTAPPVSVRVSTRVSVSFSSTFLVALVPVKTVTKLLLQTILLVRPTYFTYHCT